MSVVVLALATLALAWVTRQDVEPLKVASLVTGPVLTSFVLSQRVAPSARIARRTVFLGLWALLTFVAAGVLFSQNAAGERPRSETIALGLAAVQQASGSAQDSADASRAVRPVPNETADEATHRLLATMAAIVSHRNAANAAVAAHLQKLDLAHLLSPANIVDAAARKRGHAAIAEWHAALATIARNETNVWTTTGTLVNSLPTGMQVGAQDTFDIARHAREESLVRWLTAEKEAADISGQLLDAVDSAAGDLVLREGMLDLSPELKRSFQRAEARLVSLADAESVERETIARLASAGGVQLARLPDRWSRRDTAANGIVALAHAVNGATVDGPLPTPVLLAVHSAAPLHAVLPTLHVVQWHHNKDTQGVLARLAAFDRDTAMTPAALADPARRAATRDAISVARANLKALGAERQHYLEAVKAVVASLPSDIRSEPARNVNDAASHDTGTAAYVTASESWLNDMASMLDFADIHTDAMQLRSSRLDLPESLRGPYAALQARLAADARRARPATDALAASDRVVVAQVEQAFAGSGLAYLH